jgi:phosphopantothenoylcysteine decarboxylase / phosphopantothenate---cysteine ligase
LSAAAGDPGSGATPGAAALEPRRPWRGRRILLGVTGGIAAYKTVQLARDLTQLGARVDVVLTRAAREFVGAVTFEAVTGRPVHTELIAAGHALDHIRLAGEAEIICIAPATADFLARAAVGRGDDLLTAILLATTAPVLICPAMNDRMWAHPQTQANAAHLRTLGYRLVGPATGPLAFGEGEGPGRLEEPYVIREHIGRALEPAGPLQGRKVVVTAGPTREAVDAVRVLSNRSSGKMGYALAAACWRRGAAVALISGPVEIAPPAGPRLVRVESSEQMATAVRAELADADALIMAAAPADFQAAGPAATKIKKSAAPEAIRLAPAVDILLHTRAARPDRLVTVGFALETGDGLDSAREKLATKHLDLIVLNRADEEGAGFEVDTNRVTLIRRDGTAIELPLQSKLALADEIVDRVAELVTRA